MPRTDPTSLLFPHGIHATNDSFVYLGAAANLAEGEGWTYPFGDPGTPVTLFPPLPSAMLAIPASLDLDPLAWTLWQNALAFGVLLLLVGWTISRTSGGSWAATVVAMALTALGCTDPLRGNACVERAVLLPLGSGRVGRDRPPSGASRSTARTLSVSPAVGANDILVLAGPAPR